MHPNPTGGTGVIQCLAQGAIRAHPTGDNQAICTNGFDCRQRFLHQNFHDRRLGAGGQVGALLRRGHIAQLIKLHHYGRFQSGKRKIQIAAVEQRARQLERIGIALCR